MTEQQLTIERVAHTMGRSANFVYDHTCGLRPPDTDLLNAVAVLANTDVRALMLELVSRMASDSEEPTTRWAP